MIRLAPGGLAWLVRHELRLAFRTAGGKKKLWRRLPLLLIVAALPIGLGLSAAWALRGVGLADMPLTPSLIGVGSLALLGLLLTMAPAAAVSVLRTFNNRADLDLLLSAPVPAPRVLAAKSLGACLGVAGPYLILFGPFLLSAAALVRPGLLGGIVVLIAGAVIATAAAFVVTRALRRAIGARRARVVVQVGAGLAGAAVFLTFQLQSFAPEQAELAGRALARLRVPAPLDWPVRAVFGAPGPLLGVASFAALAGWGALRVAAGALFETPETSARTRPLDNRTPRFRGGLTRVIVMKELRLIARDPELLAQVTLRLVFLIPALALVFQGGDGAGARVAGAAAALAGFLSGSLAWLTVAAEGAPDLIAAAPAPPGPVLRAKLIAACAPPLLLAAAAAAFAARSDLWAGAVALFFAAFSALSAACLQAWHAKPAPRSAFRKRQGGGLLLAFAEVVMLLGWSGAAALMAQRSPFAVLPLILGAGMFYAAAHARAERRAALAVA